MRDLIIFIPSIEGGGVEKNLFYITSYIQSKFKNIYLITADKFKKNTFGKNIQLIMPNTTYFKNKNRFVKSLVCSYLLFKNFKKRKALVFSLQSNFFSIIFSKNILLLKKNIIKITVNIIINLFFINLNIIKYVSVINNF